MNFEATEKGHEFEREKGEVYERVWRGKGEEEMI